MLFFVRHRWRSAGPNQKPFHKALIIESTATDKPDTHEQEQEHLSKWQENELASFSPSPKTDFSRPTFRKIKKQFFFLSILAGGRFIKWLVCKIWRSTFINPFFKVKVKVKTLFLINVFFRFVLKSDVIDRLICDILIAINLSYIKIVPIFVLHQFWFSCTFLFPQSLLSR